MNKIVSAVLQYGNEDWVNLIFEDGSLGSCALENPLLQPWLDEGNTPLPYIPPSYADLDTAKATRTAEVESLANGILAASDRMIVDELEGGPAVDPAIKAYRVQVRTDRDDQLAAIAAATSVEELYTTEPSFPAPPPEYPDQSVVTGSEKVWSIVTDATAPSSDFRWTTADPRFVELQAGWVIADAYPFGAMPIGAVCTEKREDGVTVWDKQTALSGSSVPFKVSVKSPD